MGDELPVSEALGSPPDWAATTLDLACPRCGYNLRFLTVARCPECGLSFRWQEILQTAEDERSGGWTFEYQWRRRPLRAFFLTIWLCLLPWRMWRRLPLTATPRVGPLLLLIPATVLLLFLASAATKFAWYEYIKVWNATLGVRQSFAAFSWYWTPSEALEPLIAPLLLCLPLWLAVQVFRQTIARYHIRHGHILRILVFTWMGVVVWPALTDSLLTFGTMPYRWFYQRRFPSVVFSVPVVIPNIVAVVSIGFAFSTYLRVRGGWLWAALTLVLAGVFVGAPGIFLSVFYYESFSNAYWDAITEWFPALRVLPSASEYVFHWMHGYT